MGNTYRSVKSWRIPGVTPLCWSPWTYLVVASCVMVGSCGVGESYGSGDVGGCQDVTSVVSSDKEKSFFVDRHDPYDPTPDNRHTPHDQDDRRDPALPTCGNRCNPHSSNELTRHHWYCRYDRHRRDRHDRRRLDDRRDRRGIISTGVTTGTGRPPTTVMTPPTPTVVTDGPHPLPYPQYPHACLASKKYKKHTRVTGPWSVHVEPDHPRLAYPRRPRWTPGERPRLWTALDRRRRRGAPRPSVWCESPPDK